jgi:hypothetical protein
MPVKVGTAAPSDNRARTEDAEYQLWPAASRARYLVYEHPRQQSEPKRSARQEPTFDWRLQDLASTSGLTAYSLCGVGILDICHSWPAVLVGVDNHAVKYERTNHLHARLDSSGSSQISG